MDRSIDRCVSIKPNRSLFIRSIPPYTRPNDLRFAFQRFGDVKDVYIPRDFHTGNIRGFAYVEFEKLCDAEEAVKHRLRLFDENLIVEFAQGKRKTPAEMQSRYRSNNRFGGRFYRRSSPISRHRFLRSPISQRSSLKWDSRRPRIRHDSYSSRKRIWNRSRSRSRSRSAKHRMNWQSVFGADGDSGHRRMSRENESKKFRINNNYGPDHGPDIRHSDN